MIVLNATIIGGIDYADKGNFKIKNLILAEKYGLGPGFYGGIVKYVAEIHDSKFLILMNDFDGLKVVDVAIMSKKDIKYLDLRALAIAKMTNKRNEKFSLQKEIKQNEIFKMLFEEGHILIINDTEPISNEKMIDLKEDPNYAIPKAEVN